MRRIGLGLVVLLSGCVHHVRPENTALPVGLVWCANAAGAIPEVESRGFGPSSGEFARALAPCANLLPQTELESARVILKLKTNEFGYLSGMCLDALSFDEPILLECVARQVWTSSVRLEPGLAAQPYTITLLLG